jgi:hypothetical protein
MPYGTVNADVISTSVANTSLGAGNASRFKNKIINGDMRIDQRNAGASVTVASGGYNYTLDRWSTYASQASKFTVQQNGGAVTPPAGFTNYLGVTSSSAYTVGAGETFQISQFIEGLNVGDLSWGTANAKTVTLSFWVRSSLTGTFGGSLLNSAQDRSYPFNYTISSANTWTQISVTVAGDTSGTWLTTNGIGIRVDFSLGTGTTYSGAANAWAGTLYWSATGATSVVGTNGATFYITGVQLEVGSSATGFEYVDYTNQLLMCQRYYSKQSCVSGGTGAYSAFGSGYVSSSTAAWIYIKYAVAMRTAPTFSYSLIQINSVGLSAVTSANDFYPGSDSSMIIVACSGGGITAGYGCVLIASNSTSAYIAFSAEL